MRARPFGYLLLAALAAAVPALHAAGLKVVSDRAVGGFAFPESAACDAEGEALYVSQFGSALKPVEKDGKGRISKLGLDGTMVEEQFLPAAGGVLHKPKGVWVAGNRLWVTDIDAVWVFDLSTREGRKLDLPGAEFANDVAVEGDTLYVSDNRLDTVFAVTPADFLASKETPEVKQLASGLGINPNGVYPGQGGSLLLAGMGDAANPHGIHAVDAGGQTTTLAPALGRLDGLYQTADGTLLATDWGTGSLFAWRTSGERQSLAADFEGPADFCAMTADDDLLVVVPDLLKGELRLIRLQ